MVKKGVKLRCFWKYDKINDISVEEFELEETKNVNYSSKNIGNSQRPSLVTLYITPYTSTNIPPFVVTKNQIVCDSMHWQLSFSTHPMSSIVDGVTSGV